MKNTEMTGSEAPRAARRRFSKPGRTSVLFTGVAALVLFPLLAAVKAADSAVKNF